MAELTQIQRYDLLVHLTEESGLATDDQHKAIVKLFPKFNPDRSANDVYITDYIIEKYAYSRSVGLNIEDSAHSAEMSYMLISKVLIGEGLSLERFKALIKAELYGCSMMKRKHIANISDMATEDGGDYKASIAFLEKMFPEQYGQRMKIEDDREPIVPDESDRETARRIAFILAKEVHRKKQAPEVKEDST